MQDVGDTKKCLEKKASASKEKYEEEYKVTRLFLAVPRQLYR